MRTTLTVLLTLSLSVVGCGGDDTTGSTGTAGTSGGGQGGSSPAGGGGSSGSGGTQSSTAGSAGMGMGGSTGGGGGMTSNDAGIRESGLPLDASGGGDSGNAMVACGTERPTLNGLNGSEGLVIGADGTIYFSQGQAVGRLRPGAASQAEKQWARLNGANTVWGLAIDRASKMLYAGSPTTHIVYKITLTDNPTVDNLFTNAGSPNGLTMGPDGALYYTDIDGSTVYRVTPAGMRTKVNMANIASPNGLAFGSDGSLYVESYSAGSILKLVLNNGAEQSRTTFVPSGLPNDDGIAFDAMGRLYIGFNGGLSRVSADGMMIMHLAGSGGTANVEFGAGALNCKDVYFINGGNLTRFENDTAGAVVPWHLP